MVSFYHDPSEILNYKANLLVDDADSISSVKWSASPAGLTLTPGSVTTTTAIVKISAAGAALGPYIVSCHAIGVSGQEYNQRIQIQVQKQ